MNDSAWQIAAVIALVAIVITVVTLSVMNGVTANAQAVGAEANPSPRRFIAVSTDDITFVGYCSVVRDTATGKEYFIVRSTTGGLHVTPLDSQAEVSP